MILTTIAESILIDDEAETIIVKLRPVFEHLRLAKGSFKANLKTLDGTLQILSEMAKQALQNIRPRVNDLIDYGTRKKLLNTKIEPNFNGSKKVNVDDVTILEPKDKEIITNLGSKFNIYHKLILIMKLNTQTYYSIRMILGLSTN